MKAEEIYLKIREIAKPYHAYTDQFIAIAKWVEARFDYNPQKKETVKMKFKDAPIGARFKFPNGDNIWIKLNSYPKSHSNDGNGLICSWKGNVNGHQSFCSFIDEEARIDFDTEIELI
jgi:hypothetical protein